MSTPAHDQKVTRSYTVHYPEHLPRKSDPHYRDFDAYRRRTKKTAKCSIGEHRNDFSECAGSLELHHSHIEFSLQNGVDLKWLDNGQHRCQACVNSGVSVPVLFVYNVHKDSMAAIDQNKPRTVRDILLTSGATAPREGKRFFDELPKVER